MQNAVRILLLVWFVTINLFVLIPSYSLLRDTWSVADVRPVADQPPSPPTPPTPIVIPPLDPKLSEKLREWQVKAYTQQVLGYAQQVAAYGQQVAAYKTYAELAAKPRRISTYEIVVKGTLTTLLAGFAVALAGYVFAAGTTGLVDNYIRAKSGLAPQRIRLL